jgi:hypothetical protein
MFRRVIYISRSLIGADPDGIAAIVSSSVRWNAKVDVTGMLWADGQSFAQVIEGDDDAVGQTMDRIRSVRSRQFGSWSMRRAGADEASAQGTAFIIGFAMGQRTASAKRLYQIVLASDGHGA